MAKLTTKSVQTVRPGPDRREIPDGLLRGLYLVVQPSGAKSWAVRYRHTGRTRKHTLGSWPAIDLAAARRMAGKALTKAAEGIDPAIEKATARADSIEAVAELFLARHVRQHNRPRTIVEAERVMKRLQSAWRARPIASITRRDVIAHLDRVADTSGPAAANRTKAVVGKLFSWALSRDLVAASPVAGLPRPAPHVMRERVLDDRELASIWRAAELLGYPAGSFVQLLILTAARRSEVSRLAWQEIDLQARLWRLPRERAKNNVPHEIPLSEAAIAVLEACPRIGDRFVFTMNGVAPIWGFSKIKCEIDNAADVRGWTFHDLRRTAATVMADKLGIAPHVVSAVLGHVQGDRIARTYNKARYIPEKRAGLDRWAAHVLALAEEHGSKVVPLKMPASA
jgi:integrase